MDSKDITAMKLKDTKRSQTSGNVFANSKGVKDYHPLGSIPLGSFEGKNLDDIIQEFLDYKKATDERFDSVIKVLKLQKDQIKEMKGVLEKYGL